MYLAMYVVFALECLPIAHAEVKQQKLLAWFKTSSQDRT
jgi:hypothetical protein